MPTLHRCTCTLIHLLHLGSTARSCRYSRCASANLSNVFNKLASSTISRFHRLLKFRRNVFKAVSTCRKWNRAHCRRSGISTGSSTGSGRAGGTKAPKSVSYIGSSTFTSVVLFQSNASATSQPYTASHPLFPLYCRQALSNSPNNRDVHRHAYPLA